MSSRSWQNGARRGASGTRNTPMRGPCSGSGPTGGSEAAGEMPLVSTESIILQSFAYGDTSKILRLLTRTHGVRSAIAKGALRPKSRYGGILEPFSIGTAVMYLKDGRDLQTLGGFELRSEERRVGKERGCGLAA